MISFECNDMYGYLYYVTVAKSHMCVTQLVYK